MAERRRAAAAAAVPFAMLLVAAAPPTDPDVSASPKLAAALAGRAAGKPVDCINLPRVRSSTIVDHAAIIYKESSRRWYVNFPDNGACTPLAPDRAIVTRTPSTQLCQGDIITVIDPPVRFEYGSCGLGRFVPYTK